MSEASGLHSPTPSFKENAHAPDLARFRKDVATAAFKTLRGSLTAEGEARFRAEIAGAPTAQQVMDVAGRWLATLKYIETPDLHKRLRRAERAHRQGKGETPDQLFARLGL